MSLEAQISLITNPQEFSRLCTALLSADHGDDFLAIDDDRADGGNDGYLKSEERLFAVHCFKRPDKQGIEADIRRKTIGDLGKAEALKREGIWTVTRWTFISNYAMPERIGARLLQLGREAGIDVSWRGPDEIAAALRRHPVVREAFPALEVAAVAAKLDALGDQLHGLKEEAEAFEGIPAAPDEQGRLLASRPPGWEYLLYAGVLLQGRNRLGFKWRDHELHIGRGPTISLSEDEAPSFLGDAFREIAGVMEPMNRSFERRAQVSAFGAPGEPGDPAAIEHFAERTIIAYEAMLDWAARLRNLDVPPLFARLFELAAQHVDTPLGQIREFIDDVVSQVSQLPELLREAELASPERGDEPIVMKATLVVDIDANVQREFDAELKRVRRRRGWGF